MGRGNVNHQWEETSVALRDSAHCNGVLVFLSHGCSTSSSLFFSPLNFPFPHSHCLFWCSRQQQGRLGLIIWSPCVNIQHFLLHIDKCRQAHFIRQKMNRFKNSRPPERSLTTEAQLWPGGWKNQRQATKMPLSWGFESLRSVAWYHYLTSLHPLFAIFYHNSAEAGLLCSQLFGF